MSITVYTMPHCAACISLKKWLNEENIIFTEKDIINDEQAKKEFLEQKQTHAPYILIEVNKQKHQIVGFHKKKILEIIGNE